jgi:hypothetical protein
VLRKPGCFQREQQSSSDQPARREPVCELQMPSEIRPWISWMSWQLAV